MSTAVAEDDLVLRALARAVVGDDAAAVDEARGVLAEMVARGTLTVSVDMAIDSATTALSPFVDVSFRDGTHVIKSFAELDLPDDFDMG